MSVDTHVSSGSGQRLPLAVRNVLLGLWVAVLFGHAKINNVNDIGCFTPRPSDKEVVWFDISVDQVLFMDSLDTGELDRLATFDLELVIDIPSAWRP